MDSDAVSNRNVMLLPDRIVTGNRSKVKRDENAIARIAKSPFPFVGESPAILGL